MFRLGVQAGDMLLPSGNRIVEVGADGLEDGSPQAAVLLLLPSIPGTPLRPMLWRGSGDAPAEFVRLHHLAVCRERFAGVFWWLTIRSWATPLSRSGSIGDDADDCCLFLDQLQHSSAGVPVGLVEESLVRRELVGAAPGCVVQFTLTVRAPAS